MAKIDRWTTCSLKQHNGKNERGFPLYLRVPWEDIYYWYIGESLRFNELYITNDFTQRVSLHPLLPLRGGILPAVQAIFVRKYVHGFMLAWTETVTQQCFVEPIRFDVTPETRSLSILTCFFQFLFLIQDQVFIFFVHEAALVPITMAKKQNKTKHQAAQLHPGKQCCDKSNPSPPLLALLFREFTENSA